MYINLNLNVDPTEVKEVEDNKLVDDEFCTNDEYLSKLVTSERRKCSVQLYPVYPFKIETFRENVEKYFNQRQDVIEKVIACKVENHGQNVRLEAIPKIIKVWINFFNDAKSRYEDLPGVRTVVHECRDLSNCDEHP